MFFEGISEDVEMAICEDIVEPFSLFLNLSSVFSEKKNMTDQKLSVDAVAIDFGCRDKFLTRGNIVTHQEFKHLFGSRRI